MYMGRIMDSEKKPKVSRSLKIEHDMNERLIALCSHLGVNVNAYLLNEVGKCISRDEVAFKAQQQTSQANDLINHLHLLMGDLDISKED